MSPVETMRSVPARAPNGCNTPVMTQLTKAEREKIEAIAQLEVRSLSATARMLILRGIQQYEDDTHNAD
ncbi:hypothetical protein HOP54_08810 [Halomonas daqingensis]|uniref:Uncharacterized protein n=1 Tax=Billgrantia desiderata TaxID=52021 RepID=A0ABS9B8W5_9GAMM|nr:hypothetical protein [Halomonas desiderata]MCE8028788.1 hypothetical protein [Halomonas desiderata]MCE8043605.1 hypothetical protein [Halomonas desiderata]MCE8048179.1 hypothetical protein [Halomonas desiderata]